MLPKRREIHFLKHNYAHSWLSCVIALAYTSPGNSLASRTFILTEHGSAYSTRNFDRSVRCNARTISDFLCRLSDSVGPVCPQKLPDIANEQEALERMPKGRLEYLKRLLPHLRNQSEDCLYLNIYAPAMGEWTCKPTAIMLIHERYYKQCD